MDEFERLRKSIACIRIAHHQPGCLHLKLEAPANGTPMPPLADIKHFHGLIKRIAGVESLSFNLLALSCTVEYDPQILPFQSWNDFMAGIASPAAERFETLLRRKLEELAAAQPG